jgi:hypothetical protein
MAANAVSEFAHRIASAQSQRVMRKMTSGPSVGPVLYRTWKGLALVGGAGLFLSVQGLLFLTTAPIAGIQDSGWFLNSGPGVLAVGLACAVVGALVGFGRRDSGREATMVVAGAVLAMIAVLFAIGPGTIFPIVIVFGTVIIAGATAAGTAVGTAVRRAFGLGKR